MERTSNENWLGSIFSTHFLLIVVITYPIAQVVYNWYLHPLAKVPGPYAWSASRLPFVYSLIRGTIVHDIQELHRKYGFIVRIAPNEVTFAHPEAWRDILQPRRGHQQFPKDSVWWKTQPGMSDSLISAINIESHARIRKALAPGFTQRALQAQEPILQFYVSLLVKQLLKGVKNTDSKASEVDIVPWLNFTTFDIFGDLGFGESFNCLQYSKYHPWVALLFNSVKAASFVISARFYPLVEYMLLKCIPPSLKKMQRDHYEQIVEKVQRRLNFELERPDIMSHVINQEENVEEGMTHGEINSTFMVLTTAGSETTATTLAGTLNYLVNNTDKLNALVREIRSSFRSEHEITLDTLRGLRFLNAVISEGLRLCPAIPWILPRQVPAGGDTVCGVWLPSGTSVSIQAYTMYRDPLNFHDPVSFLPERWLPEASSDAQSVFYNDRRHAVQPFSVGPRSCMGQHIAWAEMRLILSRLLWTFDLEAIEGNKVQWEDLRTFLLVEKQPIMIKISPRAMDSVQE